MFWAWKTIRNQFLQNTRLISYIISIIKINNNQKPFQTQLQTDTNKIKTDTTVYVAADKTNNFYKIQPEQYNKLVQQNVDEAYKKAPPSTCHEITATDKTIASKHEINDRVDTTWEK